MSINKNRITSYSCTTIIGGYFLCFLSIAASPLQLTSPHQIKIKAQDGKSILGWSATPLANSYHVKRSHSKNGQYTLIGSPKETSFTDSDLSNGGTYYYKISAVTDQGEESADSQPTIAKLSSSLGAPNHLTASISQSTIRLAWIAASGASFYRTKRALSPDGPFEIDPSSSLILNYSKATHFQSTGLTQDKTYYFQVTAMNDLGEESSPSQTVSLKFHAEVPLPPTNLQTVSAPTGVEIRWKGASGNDSYQVKRSQSQGGPFSLISSPVKDGVFTDSAVTTGETYYYKVSATNSAGEGKDSKVTAPITFKLFPLKAFPVTAIAGSSGVELKWQALDGAKYYAIERAPGGSRHYTRIEKSVHENEYQDNLVTLHQGYTYRVVAMDSDERPVAISPELTAKAGTKRGTPFPVDTQTTPNGLALTWPEQTGAKSYLVKRSFSVNGPYELIGKKVIESHFVDQTIDINEAYYYVVGALDRSGDEFVASTPTQAKAAASLEAPTWLPAQVSSSKIELHWSPFAGAKSYNVKRSIASDGPFTNIASALDQTRFVDSQIDSGKTYYYIVAALGPKGESQNSKTLSLITIGRK